jgi:hypothetical protein
MNTTRMPGFSAEASFYRSNAHYQTATMMAGSRQGGKGIIQPALPMDCDCYNTMKGRLCCCSRGHAAACCDLNLVCDIFKI